MCERYRIAVPNAETEARPGRCSCDRPLRSPDARRPIDRSTGTRCSVGQHVIESRPLRSGRRRRRPHGKQHGRPPRERPRTASKSPMSASARSKSPCRTRARCRSCRTRPLSTVHWLGVVEAREPTPSSRNDTFLPRDSISVTRAPGWTMAITRPGNPAPLPRSTTASPSRQWAAANSESAKCLARIVGRIVARRHQRDLAVPQQQQVDVRAAAARPTDRLSSQPSRACATSRAARCQSATALTRADQADAEAAQVDRQAATPRPASPRRCATPGRATAAARRLSRSRTSRDRPGIAS